MDRKTLRSQLGFEVLAKLFFDLADERYPSADKMKQMVAKVVSPLTPDPLENVYINIAVLNMMRDMIKEVAPTQLYRSMQHRDDLYLAIIEALEDLEDELEDIEIQSMEEEEKS